MNLDHLIRVARASLFALIVFTFIVPVVVAQDEDEDEVVIEGEWDDPDAPIDTRFEKAREYNVSGEFEKAWKLYDEILKDRGPDAPTLITYGNMKWRAGDLKEAEEKLKAAWEANPKHIKAQQFLGQLYYHQGRRKLARERFEYMHTLEFMRQDVLDSAKLNLGRISLQEEKYREARKHFMHLRKIGGHADRKSGNRGMNLVQMMLAMDSWPRHDSVHLKLHFSPNLKYYAKPEARKELGDELDPWVGKVVQKLGIPSPEPWQVYIFRSDGECSAITGRPEAHGWDYSWWFSYNAVEDGYPIRHTLAVMLASRWGGSRPMSRSMVEGFCNFLADDGKDPHRFAIELAKEDRLPTLGELHVHQRRLAQYGAGISWVDFFIRRHGIEDFRKLWCRFNIEANMRKYKKGRSKTIDFPKVFDVLFKRFAGESRADFEGAWRQEVRARAGLR